MATDLPTTAAPLADRPFAHVTEKTLGSQISKYRVDLRKLAMKEARGETLTAKEVEKRGNMEGRLQGLLEEKTFRSGQPQRPFAHWTDERINAQLEQLRTALYDATTVTDDLARREALRAEQRKLATEQSYRRAHPAARFSEADIKAQAAQMAAPSNPAIAAVREARARFQATVNEPGGLFDGRATRDDLQQVEQQITAVGNQVREEYERRLAAQGLQTGAFGADVRDTLLKTLSEVRPMGPSPNRPNVFAAAKGNREGKAATLKAAEFYPRDWLDKLSDAAVTFKKTARGSFNGGSSFADIALSEGSARVPGDSWLFGAAAHELGHAMEWRVPGVTMAEKMFYRRRTLGEELTRLPGKKTEWTRPDEFQGAYMGRDYSDDPAGLAAQAAGGQSAEIIKPAPYYEILTTAMESFTTGRYSVLAGDKDMTNFVLGLLTLL